MIEERYEIAKILADNFTPEEYDDSDFEWCAYQLIQEGYHKDTEAKWISCKNNSGYKCSRCGARIKNSARLNGNHNFCHKCGSVMKGANNDR